MQIHRQSLLDKEDSVLSHHFFDQLFEWNTLKHQIIVKAFESQILEDQISIGVNLKELLLHLFSQVAVFYILNQELAGRNRCLNLVDPESIVIHQVIIGL